MTNLILLNKPFNVLSQFTDNKSTDRNSTNNKSTEKRDADTESRSTLADFISEKGFYPAGRLDYDSEGLLLLTSDGKLQHQIAHPKKKMPKTYWVQVEGDITADALSKLSKGVELKDGLTKPAKAKKINEPSNLWSRNPPIRERANIPTSWIALTITEGRNRQVRRMTAAVGFPTLRLIRYSIGPWTIDGLKNGDHKSLLVNVPDENTSKPRQVRKTPSKRSHTAKNTRNNSSGKPKRPRKFNT